MKKIKQHLSISGIYCIINIVNNKRYIGSSKNIRLRLFSHRHSLRNKVHENPHLQNAYNKYGECNMDYYILECCKESELLEREQFYINTLNPEYNINLNASKPPCSKESRRKQSETRKRLYKEGKLKPSFKHLITYVYDLNGNFLKEYPSMKDAAIGEFGKNTGAVRNACYGYQNPYHRVHNRLFYLKKLDSVPAWNKDNIIKINSRKNYIVKFDNTELEFKGVTSIAEYFNTTKANIAQYIDSKMKYKRKYMILRKTAP